MMKQKILFALAGVFLVIGLTGCDDFFSTTWGVKRGYDSSKIELTLDNLQDLVDAAEGNPELAEALAKAIIKKIGQTSGTERAKYQEAGIDAAIEQAGLGTAIVNSAMSLLSDIDNIADNAPKLFNNILSDLIENAPAAASNIAAIAGATISAADSTPEFAANDPYAAAASPSDVTQAVMILAMSMVPAGFDFTGVDSINGVNSNLTVTEEGSPKKVGVTEGATKEEVALAAYLNLIASDPDGKYENNSITSAIKSMFGLE
ncbi:MAG: hypothetical protein LBR23_00470 [Spirochaetaceae bacterium]|jgi:hypothetical protein|nr:hypothetical protein [Spirochaetaceae bacterium]